jgi:multidrug resistance efflux pump
MSKLDDAFKASDIEDHVQHVRDSVHINGGDLRHELERLPADLAHYGFQFAAAHRKMLAAKMALEDVRSAEYLMIRETMTDLGHKVTEALLDAKILESSSVQDARANLLEAEHEREQLRAVCDALRAKRENLVSLVNLARAELAGTQGFRGVGETEQT